MNETMVEEQIRIDSFGVFTLLGAIFGDSPGIGNIDDVCQAMEKVLISLTERQKRVLELRFGLRDGHYQTYEEIGKEFHLTKERIRQIEGKALQRLRHPTRRHFILSTLLDSNLRYISQDLNKLRTAINDLAKETEKKTIDIITRRVARFYDLTGVGSVLIENMNLPNSILNPLRHAGLTYVYELLDKERLRYIPGIGVKGTAKIYDALKVLKTRKISENDNYLLEDEGDDEPEKESE